MNVISLAVVLSIKSMNLQSLSGTMYKDDGDRGFLQIVSIVSLVGVVQYWQVH